MVFLTLRAAWLRRQRAKANKANKAVRQVVTAGKLSPKSLMRYSATSRNAYQSTALERNRIATLKRVLRRRVSRMRHFNEPLRREGVLLLRPYLRQEKEVAIARSRMSPVQRRRNTLARRLLAIRRVFWSTNLSDDASWKKFVRIYLKSGGSPSITINNAMRMFN
jgi:hypothetical protein